MRYLKKEAYLSRSILPVAEVLASSLFSRSESHSLDYSEFMKSVFILDYLSIKLYPSLFNFDLIKLDYLAQSAI